MTTQTLATPAGAGDFDFFIGHWRVRHRRLKERLAGSDEWVDFVGTCNTQKLLGGAGNMDDNWLDLPGEPYRAVTLRAFDPATGLWAIWWLDGRHPTGPLDPPMKGRFEGGIGTFFADIRFNGQPVRIRFLWSQITPRSCRWQQAFSADGEETWETNWVMDFARSE